MSFSDALLSIFGGKPVDLYRFTHQSDVWTYCPAKTVTYDSEEYTQYPVKRSRHQQSDEMAKDALTITVPYETEISQLYLYGIPETTVGLKIFTQDNDGTSDYTICRWMGRVLGAKHNENRCELTCESIYTKTHGRGNRYRCTRQCQAPLYDPNECGVDKDYYAVAGTVSAITSQTVLTISAASGYDDGEFYGGMLKDANGILRTITAHSGSSITISYRIDDLAVDDAVTIYPGCDRTMTRCANKFDNLAKFKGFPWLPLSDPTSTRIA